MELFIKPFFVGYNMQRKMLFMLIALNCSMVYGDKLIFLEEQIKQKKIEKHELEQLLEQLELELCRAGCIRGFQKALIDELSGKVGAIRAEFDQTTKENENEFVRKKANKCNGSHTFGEPDKNSSAGRKFEAYRQNLHRKNKLNQDYLDLTIKKRDEFPIETGRLIKDQHELMESYIKNFNFCGNDIECIRSKGMSLEVIASKDFSDNVVATPNKHIHNALVAQGISVTPEQLELIIERQKIKNDIESLAAISKEVNQRAYSILNPKSAESDAKPSIFENQDSDIKTDQNDQGALSQ